MAKVPEKKNENEKEKKREKKFGQVVLQTGKFSFSDGACVWCMWLSDLGSGFGKIVKCQTDLQKKCQKGLHNDMEKNENHVSGKCFWEGSFWEAA